ncbi:MAG: tetratricopeptide repeat protein [Spirochaetaceae bacterium]|jgi:tetratricopeptide (TPR) repeat protein|nr:tetratricopeptide repeat protein [Spirochaetaceae bacterium]
MENDEIHTADDKDSLYNFFEKNRKFLFVSGLVIMVLLVGLIAALLLRDFIQKDAIAKLDVLVERYDGVKDSLAAGSGTAGKGGTWLSGEDVVFASGTAGEGGTWPTGEDEVSASAAAVPVDGTADGVILALLDDLKALGKGASGYPAARAWFMAANIHHERGEWQEALEAWLLAAKKGGAGHLAPVCLYNAAVAAEAVGDTDSALANYQKSITFPDFPAAAHAQFSVARLEETKGDSEAAIAAYRAVIEKWPADTGWTSLAHSRIIALEAGGQ